MTKRVVRPAVVVIEDEEETLEGIRPTGRIQPVRPAEETSEQRLMRKHIPAWVASGGVHLFLIVTLLVVQFLYPTVPTVPPTDIETRVEAAEPEDQPPENFNSEFGLDSDPKTKPPDTDPPEPPSPPRDIEEEKGPIDLDEKRGAKTEGFSSDEGAQANIFKDSRSLEHRDEMLKKEGGSKESELAVGRGLAWLASQQKSNGSWSFDGDASSDTVASTGLALLPFLAAGQTHKASKENTYHKTILKGLKFLIAQQRENGSFNGGTTATRMYAQGIATVALCESLGMSGDSSFLHLPAQRAVKFITKSQAQNGGWTYLPNDREGDISVTGWQIQALHSARLSGDVTVSKDSFTRASKFLDSVASGDNGGLYGYKDNKHPTPARTAVGLLSRYYATNWRTSSLGMIDGVAYMIERGIPSRTNKKDIYYLYYATQVMHNYGGKEWEVQWNPSVRNFLIETQVQGSPENAGSWDPEGSTEAQAFGRLGQTCFSVLTLEVYYRMTPLFKQRASGGNEQLK